jgi:hypothetical protein
LLSTPFNLKHYLQGCNITTEKEISENACKTTAGKSQGTHLPTESPVELKDNSNCRNNKNLTNQVEWN